MTHEEKVAKWQAVWDRQGFVGAIACNEESRWQLAWYVRPTVEQPVRLEFSLLNSPQHGINVARRMGMKALYLPDPLCAELDVFPGAPVPLAKLPVS
jgi:hypothetical protein